MTVSAHAASREDAAQMQSFLRRQFEPKPQHYVVQIRMGAHAKGEENDSAGC
jgi:hypothetical protein